MGKYTYTTTNGDTTISTEYSCDKKSFAYTTISDDIKIWFDFLLENGSICNNLNQMLNYLQSAADIQTGFNISCDAGSSKDIQHVYKQINEEVNKLKSSMVELHNALDKDVDNINAELEVNFGYWTGYDVKAGKTTTTKNSEK